MPPDIHGTMHPLGFAPMDLNHGDHGLHIYGRHDRAMVWLMLYVGRMVNVGQWDVFCTIPIYVRLKR